MSERTTLNANTNSLSVLYAHTHTHTRTHPHLHQHTHTHTNTHARERAYISVCAKAGSKNTIFAIFVTMSMLIRGGWVPPPCTRAASMYVCIVPSVVRGRYIVQFIYVHCQPQIKKNYTQKYQIATTVSTHPPGCTCACTHTLKHSPAPLPGALHTPPGE